MQITYIHEVRVAGVLTNATSLVFSDPTNSYGIRDSSGGIVVANGTVGENFATGRYRVTFTATPGETYNGYAEVLLNGATDHVYFEISAVSGFTEINPGEAFTSRAEIERLFSQEGVDFRLDDADEDALNDVITDATEIILQYAWVSYEFSDLLSSSWVRRRATWIAAYFLSMRRGNPAQYVDRYNAIVQELQMIYAKNLWIPRLGVKENSSPALSIPIMDNRLPYPQQRVIKNQSIGTYPGQDTGIGEPPLFW